MTLKTTDEAQRFARRYRAALLEIHGKTEGCIRLVWPSECRGRTGYPRAEWCTGCIAADALQIAVARPVEVAIDSEPKEGPLRGITKWGGNIATTVEPA